MTNSLSELAAAQLQGMNTIAWFGLAADPPTLAHRTLMDAVLGSGLFQKAVVFPAGKLDYKDFIASDWQRWDMIQIWKSAADYGDDVVLGMFDMLRDQATPWIDLWKEIKSLLPNTQHWLVVGSDQYLQMEENWKDGRRLMMKARIVVVPRDGFPVKRVLAHHQLINIKPLPGSSTSARLGDLNEVDEKVREYIRSESLYQSL